MDALMTNDTSEADGIKVYVGVVNPEFATHLLRSAEYPRQRPLREANIRRLAGEMTRGWYVKGTPLTFACMPNGDTYLLNGQHSLTAVAETGIPMAFVFIFHRVKTMEEVAHIYSVLDIHHPRSWGDAMRAAGLGEMGIPLIWHNVYGGAIRTAMTGFRSNTRYLQDGLMQSREFQLRLWGEYADYAKMFIEAVGGGQKRAAPFKRSGVMAVGMETFRHAPDLAAHFWSVSADDDGLKNGDPRKAMLTYLRSGTSYTREHRQLMMSAASIAWNHFAANTKLTNIHPSSVAKIIIDRTPWNGGSFDPFAKLVSKVTPKTQPAKYMEIETGVLYEANGDRTPITNFIGNWSDSPPPRRLVRA